MNKIKKIFANDTYLLYILLLFMIIQPFLDIEVFFTNSKLFILGLTIPTIIRCLIIFFMLLFFIKDIKYKKNFKYFILYFLILIVYFIIHHFIVNSNTLNLPNNYTYSLFSELFYIIRMIFPFILIYITCNSKIDEDRFLKVIQLVALIIGLSIFLMNTLHISLISYKISGGKYNMVNWLQWPSVIMKQYEYELTTSKGWFYMANQISGLMMLILPISLYGLFKKADKLSIFANLLLIISMIMLSTRVSGYGWILVLIYLVILLIINKFILKRKDISYSNIKYLIVMLPLIIMLFFNSPILKRTYGYNLGNIDENSDNILDQYKEYGIQEMYILKIYPYTYDKEFWLDIFKLSRKQGVIENRQMESLISKRISIKNSSIKYKLFGYSFSKMRNAGLYVEHDLIAQYYTIGILGVILLIGPYFLIIIYSILLMFKKIKEKLNIKNVILLSSICIVLAISVFTGHILDELIVTLYMGFIIGFLIKELNKDEKMS